MILHGCKSTTRHADSCRDDTSLPSLSADDVHFLTFTFRLWPPYMQFVSRNLGSSQCQLEPAVAVTIGRVAGDMPMSDAKWNLFRQELTSLITTLGGTIWVRNSGVGLWDGMREDNYVVVSWLPSSQTGVLRELASLLGKKYNQQTIAILTGDSEVVPCALDLSFNGSSTSSRSGGRSPRHSVRVETRHSGGNESSSAGAVPGGSRNKHLTPTQDPSSISASGQILISPRFTFENK